MRFFTSDLHLSHRAMAGPDGYCGRPWADVEAMNAGLLQRWNDVVGGDDEVYVLGDLTLRNPAPNGVPAPWLVDWLAAANGTKYLILGNHDSRAWKPLVEACREMEADRPGNFDSWDRWERLYEELGLNLSEDHCATIGDGLDVLISHLPMTRTPHESVSEAEYQLMVPNDGDPDVWRLHGHVHTQWQQHGREINVGVDAWNGQPVAEDIIESIITMEPMDIPARPWAE